MSRATVITDASFCPKTRSAGWAAWCTINYTVHGIPQVNRIKRYGKFNMKPRNSTEAERWACYNGVWLAVQAGATDILCQTDCLSVVQSQSHGLLYKKIPNATKVSFRHVKGHTDREEPRFFVNRWCDKHARIPMEEQRRHG